MQKDTDTGVDTNAGKYGWRCNSRCRQTQVQVGPDTVADRQMQTDTDTGTDTEADAHRDADAGTDTDAETDTNCRSRCNTNTDAGTEADADIDADTKRILRTLQMNYQDSNRQNPPYLRQIPDYLRQRVLKDNPKTVSHTDNI